MDRSRASIATVVSVERFELTAEAVPALKTLFGLDRLPLAQSRITIELVGVPTAVVNAFRRVVTDEMPGRALRVPADGFDPELTTDVFMLPQFVNGRISCLRLRPQIPPEVVAGLRLKLDVENPGATPRVVYAGDLEVAEGSMPFPLFNPTTKLGFIQPGKRIVIRGIHIQTGVGRDDAVFNVACCAAYTHLDLEQHSADEMREGKAADESGYLVSSLLATPLRHRLWATLPATTANPAESIAVFADACVNIKERLRLIASAIERRDTARGIQYTVVKHEAGLSEGILRIPGETHTIGELVRRAIADLVPGIANVSYTIAPHENCLQLLVRHTEDVTAILLRAIQKSITTFDAIREGLRSSH